MAVEAKICGLSTPETVDAAVRFGARFVGFVTYPKSPRHISTETMRALGARVPKTVTRVGLFVDPDDALLDEKLATGALDLLQLHGGETPERVAAIRQRTGKPVMKVIKVARAARRRARHRGLCRRRRPPDVRCGRGHPAGRQRQGVRLDVPVGPYGAACRGSWPAASTPGNVAEAVRVTGARAVDVSSGVENQRGVKSIDLIRAFLDAVKAL